MLILSGSGTVGAAAGVATSVIFMGAADHESSTTQKWPDGGAPAIAAAESGAHGSCYDNATLREAKLFGSNLSTVSAGMRFKIRTDSTDNIMRFQDTASNNQMVVRYVAGGAFAVGRGATPTILATSSAGLISTGTWYYLEFAVTINNTTGSYTAKLYDDAGALLGTLTASSVDTQDTANAYADRIDVGGTTCDSFTDNLWVDTSGALYGPLRIETLRPTGAGTTTQWGRGGADSGANWSQVDESVANGTTDTVVGVTNNTIDLYTFGDRSLTGGVHAVQINAMSSPPGVGGLQIKLVVRIAGTNYFSSTLSVPTTSANIHYCMGTNPATSAAWTTSDVNNAEFGIQAINTSANILITQVAVEVLSAI